jgi:hypothetical protein
MTTPWFDTNYTPAGGHPAALTFTAGAEILDGQLVMIEAGENNRVIPCGAGAASPYAGVAGQHAAALGEVTVLTGSGVIHESVAAAAIPAGNFILPAANGAVAGGGTSSNALGVCVRGSVADATQPSGFTPCRWLSYH